ncbi:MAG: hypothetical protein U0P45_03700 [Acidimicrobiales bacterium]
MQDQFPVLPFRTELYRPEELFDGLRADDPASYASTLDFRAYRSMSLPRSREVGMLRALHDECIFDEGRRFIDGHQVVAVMGGHALARTDPAYRQVAELSRAIARRGFLLLSGGGPGAMEATHLGAMLAPAGDLALDEALGALAEVPDFPETKGIVAPGGGIDPAKLAALHAWSAPAFRLLDQVPPEGRGASMSVPTWFYGHEPPTPFATHIAKLFSNPLREDGLLAAAVDGVIYGPGASGTVQEVFQDASQNAYRTVLDRFSPMVLLDVDGFWSRQVPVLPVLRALFGDEDFERYVLTTDDPDEIVAFLCG